MIQDIFPHKFDNQYYDKTPQNDDFVLVFENGHIFMDNRNMIKSFTIYEIICKSLKNEDILENSNFIYLFSIDNMNFFLGVNLCLDETKNIWRENIQIFRKLEPRWMAFAGITSYQLFKWYSEHIYCGKCCKPLKHSTTERALICDDCKIVKYPKISPAVIVGITNQEKILMSRYANGVYKRYALIAGFTEVGETLEETVKREVMEEVGLVVKNIRYYKNQPWSFSDSLLIGFFAELDGSDIIKIDENELEEAKWFTRDEIPASDSNISLTSEMIEAFRNGEL